MLAKLLYRSTRNPECTDGELEKILDSAQRNNQPLDITGVLLYDQSRFIQYMEGPTKEISQLYDKIKTDTRHKEVRMVAFGPLAERRFPTWAMGSKSIKGKVSIQTKEGSKTQSTIEDLLTEDKGNQDLALDWLVKFVKES